MDPRADSLAIFDKLSNTTIRERVYQELKNKILLGEIRPGQAISQKDLARQFGVSVIPIREALFQLASEEIICGRSNKDFHIRELTAEEFCEIRDMRLLLEPFIVQRACQRYQAQDVLALNEIWKAFETSTGDFAQYLRLNREFHFRMYTCAQLPITLNTVTSLWARIGAYISIYTQMKGTTSQTNSYHRRMFEGFSERNVEAVVTALRDDITASADNIIGFIKDHSLFF